MVEYLNAILIIFLLFLIYLTSVKKTMKTYPTQFRLLKNCISVETKFLTIIRIIQSTLFSMLDLYSTYKKNTSEVKDCSLVYY